MVRIGTKMRYFKIPFCQIFFEKSENIPDQRVYECRMLGQKLGYDTSTFVDLFLLILSTSVVELING